MQYWNYLDQHEDDEREEDDALLGEVQSDFDGASDGTMRETNPAQQYFDFGEMLTPNIDDVDRLSGYQEPAAEAVKESMDAAFGNYRKDRSQPNPDVFGEKIDKEPPGPDDGRRAENDLGGRNPLDREGQ